MQLKQAMLLTLETSQLLYISFSLLRSESIVSNGGVKKPERT